MDNLSPALLGALAEVARYRGQNRLYWWRRASMMKLAEMGLVEAFTPPSMIHSRGKLRPYRVTDAGVAALSSDPQPLGSAREATEGNPVEDEPLSGVRHGRDSQGGEG